MLSGNYTVQPEQKYSIHSIYFQSFLTHSYDQDSCGTSPESIAVRPAILRNQTGKSVIINHSTSSQELWLKGEAMQGIELVNNLAELDRKLVEKLEEARRTAESRIASAQEKARQILSEAEIQIRQMEGDSKNRITEEVKKLAAEAQARAEDEAARIGRQADSKIEHAVRFTLSEVLP
jgi:vacuolar-type H+-ATPase subunit H